MSEDPQHGTLNRLDLARNGGRAGTGSDRGARSRLRGYLLVGGLAVAVLVLLVVVGRPLISSAAVGLAQANPQLLKVPVVAGFVRDQLGDKLRQPAGSDPSPVKITITEGQSAGDVAAQLVTHSLIGDPLVFEYLAITGGGSAQLQIGTFVLNQTMTPDEILQTLQQPPPPDIGVTLALRGGLRIEQVTAYLQTRALGKDVPHRFYELAMHPTGDLRAAYPFLSTLPAGRSLEGYLGSGTFAVDPDVTGEQVVKLLLDQWAKQVGQPAFDAARAKGVDFYATLTLASIVEKEAAVDAERPLIAGVYTNRLDPKRWSTLLLDADPTVIYANDTMELAKLPFEQWQKYSFWNLVDGSLSSFQVTSDLAGYQTYQRPGLPPGPIASPTMASVQAALAPSTTAGYLYFVAKNDGSHTHAFARTYAEHQANLRKYGYIK